MGSLPALPGIQGRGQVSADSQVLYIVTGQIYNPGIDGLVPSEISRVVSASHFSIYRVYSVYNVQEASLERSWNTSRGET